jgi:NAD(P)-dependent dehydrogenase (short-subunit alcohol dehydrogenase family)
MRLRGKVALVTGGTAGIGAGIVEMFAREGASVAFTGRTKSTGTALEKTLRGRGATATYIQADSKSEADVAAAIAAAAEAYGPVTVLVNNAAATDVTISDLFDFHQIRPHHAEPRPAHRDRGRPPRGAHADQRRRPLLRHHPGPGPGHRPGRGAILGNPSRHRRALSVRPDH